MIGVYKITSPSNNIYIGQSIDIVRRFNVYKKLICKTQIKLYRSFLKYGVENHKFEVIEECSINFLNERERYWQEYYDVIGKKGLNCQLTNSKDKKMIVSNETKDKLRKASLGQNNCNFGKQRPEETRIKISLSNKGIKRSEETRLKISIYRTGKKASEEAKEKMRQSAINRRKK